MTAPRDCTWTLAFATVSLSVHLPICASTCMCVRTYVYIHILTPHVCVYTYPAYAQTRQPGITCVPIMCPPYPAPPHATVVPTGKVQAGNRVTIACDFGYRAMQLSDRAPADWPKWGPGRRPSDLAGSAAPLCLNTATYEEGIECIPVPVQCDAYPAPPHGSVWGPGGEYKIASPAGLEGWPRQESLFVTCDAGYRLSEHGRQTVRCLRSGQWEVGKTCVPIMCQVCLCL